MDTDGKTDGKEVTWWKRTDGKRLDRTNPTELYRGLRLPQSKIEYFKSKVGWKNEYGGEYIKLTGPSSTSLKPEVGINYALMNKSEDKKACLFQFHWNNDYNYF